METVQGVLAFLLAGTGLFLGIWLRFVPLSAPRRTVRLLRQVLQQKGEGITPRRALMTGLAGSVGVGNIAGVACALTAGGPGAVFWMNAAALLGMETAFAEGVLAAHCPGTGAAGYIRAAGYEKGARFFCWACVLTSLGMGGMAQARAAADACITVGVSRTAACIFLAGTALLFGGRSLQSAGKWAERLVPVMSAVFLVLCGGVLLRYPRRIVPALQSMVCSAFHLRACAGGAAGYSVRRAVTQGVVRGAFSNEAGLGTGPFAYGGCRQQKPAAMGALASLQVGVDTVFLCTLTALCLLCAGWEPGTDGAAACFSAFGRALGIPGKWLLSFCVLLFALAAMLSWSAYGRAALHELAGGNSRFFAVLFAGTAAAGCLFSRTAAVLQICDLFNLLMAVPNLLALWKLRRGVLSASREFSA